MAKHRLDEKANRIALQLIRDGKHKEAAILLKKTSKENQQAIIGRFEYMRSLLK